MLSYPMAYKVKRKRDKHTIFTLISNRQASPNGVDSDQTSQNAASDLQCLLFSHQVLDTSADSKVDSDFHSLVIFVSWSNL